MNRTELSQRLARAEAALTQIPGVVGVGYGLKEVKGKTTEERSFRVYVREKKKLEDLEPSEIIPSEYEGIPTDVIRVRRVSGSGTEDTSRHSPLIGGISITNFNSSGSGIEVGTLGCFGTIDGASGPDNVVCLTNNHVISVNGASIGSTIFQPRILPGGLDAENKGAIGVIHNVGAIADHPFAYPTESQFDYFIDCATAKLNISISSWCNTNCGVSYKNELRELNIGGNSKIEGMARAVDGSTVFKSGRRTGATEGRITDVSATVQHDDLGIMVHRVIVIEPVAPEPVFSDKGDSGSAMLNNQNEIVGLLFGDNSDTFQTTGDPPLSTVCHIHPVIDFLAVTPISTQNPPVGPAGQARSDIAGILDDGINETMTLRERFLAVPRGAEMYARFLEHREEVVALVNHCRPVTVAWHRAKGPAFLSHMIENIRNPAHRIPFEIDGIDRKALIVRMADVLIAHGSGALRGAVAARRAEVLALIDQFDDLHAFVGRFEQVLADA